MDYEVAMDPRLGITAEEFVAAWNELPQCREVAEAHVGRSCHGQEAYGLDTVALLAVVTPIMAASLGAALGRSLHDLVAEVVRTLIGKKGAGTDAQPVNLTVNIPEGAQLVVVHVAENGNVEVMLGS